MTRQRGTEFRKTFTKVAEKWLTLSGEAERVGEPLKRKVEQNFVPSSNQCFLNPFTKVAIESSRPEMLKHLLNARPEKQLDCWKLATPFRDTLYL